MKASAPSRLRRFGRLLWRCVRTGLVLLLLFVAAAAVYMNQFGLPEAAKRRVVAGLRAEGWEVEYSRMRLHGLRAILAENIYFQRANETGGPQLFVEEAEFVLNRAAIRNLDLELDALFLRGGRLLWPLQATNQTPRTLALTGIRGEVRFHPNALCELRDFTAEWHGVQLKVTGALTNAADVRFWKSASPSVRPTRTTEELLHDWAAQLDMVHCAPGSSLAGTLHGDARARVFFADWQLKLPAVRSPWGTGTNVVLALGAQAATAPEGVLHARAQLRAEQPNTPWGRSHTVELSAQFDATTAQAWPSNATLQLQLETAETIWGTAANLQLSADVALSPTDRSVATVKLNAVAQSFSNQWLQAGSARLKWQSGLLATNLSLLQGEAQIDGVHLKTDWGGAREAQASVEWNNPATNILFAAGVTNPAARFATIQSNWWTLLQPVALRWRSRVTGLTTPQVRDAECALTAHWQAPEAVVDSFEATLFGGHLNFTAALNATNGVARFNVASDVDAQQGAPLLATNTRRWLAQYSWEQAPKFTAHGQWTVPGWTNVINRFSGDTNAPPIPWADAESTLQLAGTLQSGPGAFRGVTFTSAQATLTHTNEQWFLPRVLCLRPEGELEFSYIEDGRTMDYRFDLRSRIDPLAMKPLVNEAEARRGFELFQFTETPWIEGQLCGRWRDASRLGLAVRIAATNFSFRGEPVREFRAKVSFTNDLVTGDSAFVRRAEGQAEVPLIVCDLNREKIFLSNAVSTLDPQAVARAISDKARRTLVDYQFATPPAVKVNGVVDLIARRNEHDLHFEVDGAGFRWRNFRLPRLAGQVDWVGDFLALTKLRGEFYGGGMTGFARFDFTPETSTDFSFSTSVTNASLPALLGDISVRTNRLEGVLSGELTIAAANTARDTSWQGEGRVRLDDGLIWDLPVFGVFSKISNRIIPGLGNSRAKEASATFIITNSVIRTHDLRVHATAMRMQYKGSVDFATRVDGRMEAELLRDVPGLGVLFSKVFWPVTKLFEFRVTGTLDDPKVEQLYLVSKLVLLPFHPIRTLKELFPGEPPKETEKK